jgi:hypothetical protein
MIDLTEAERLALAYVIALEQQATRSLAQSGKLADLLDKLLSGRAEFSNAERSALADRARREIQTDRYPLAPQLGPLRSAFEKLAPADEPPKPPVSGRRKARR